MRSAGMYTSVFESLKHVRSVQDLAALDITAFIRRFAPHGVRHFELSMDTDHLTGGAMTAEIVEKSLELKAAFGLTYSVHLPFRGIDLAYPDAAIREGMTRSLAGMIGMLKPLEPVAYVLHPAGASAKLIAQTGYGSPLTCRFLDALVDALTLLSQRAGIPPALLALENVNVPFQMNAEVMRRLPISMCLDYGHVCARRSGEWLDIGEILSDFGRRMIAVHVHDVRRTESGYADHLPLGRGEADMAGFFRRLAAIGYAGYVVAEVKGTPETIFESAMTIQALIGETEGDVHDSV